MIALETGLKFYNFCRSQVKQYFVSLKNKATHTYIPCPKKHTPLQQGSPPQAIILPKVSSGGLVPGWSWTPWGGGAPAGSQPLASTPLALSMVLMLPSGFLMTPALLRRGLWQAWPFSVIRTFAKTPGQGPAATVFSQSVVWLHLE